MSRAEGLPSFAEIDNLKSTAMLDKTLEQLFESTAKIRTLRLFLMNPDNAFTADEAKKHTRLSGRQFKNELNKLMKIGLVATRIDRFTFEMPGRIKKGRKKALKLKIKISRKKVFFADKTFLLYPELRSLVFKMAPDGRGALLSKIKKLGDIKLALVSGVFTDTDSARADLVLVGDKLKKERISKFFRGLQAEVGKELNYAVMTSQEFNYRFNMQDRFIRDVLDFPHEKLINKLGI
ncbi:MAG: hypothetical protein Q7R91_01340 [bacterium]|nr:hypothetical protein [bacterium]